MTRATTRRNVLKAIGAAVTVPGAMGTVSAHEKPTTARFAAFNVYEFGTEQVQERGDEQAEAAARIVQEIRPDVLVLNELANNFQEGERTDRANVDAFVENYLSVPQRDDLEGIDYPYTLQPDSNTGVLPAEEYDFNKDGEAGQRPDDAFGFGFYPGQYAFAVASRYPFDEDAVRTFREFLWADMPDNLVPLEGDEGVETGEGDIYLTEEELEVYRLSSKNHVDVPFRIDGETVHGLFSHPTPPVFDGDNNFNGRWNHDEIRFFADYVAGADYIYDDCGTEGGLEDDAAYVLMGDMNADPKAEDRPLDPATTYFVENEDFETRRLPTSPGGAQLGNPYATAEFGGGSQVDWVLPSPNLSLRSSSVVWPSSDSDKRGLREDVETASDHRMVWADVATE